MEKKKTIGIIISGIFCLFCVGVAVAVPMVAKSFDNILRPFFGTSGRNYTKVIYDGVDQIYYKNSSDEKTIKNEEKELSKAIAEEGIVLLETGNIPYNTTQTNFSLFSKSSVDFVFGGTGSGVAYSTLTLKSALETAGFKVNNTLWNFYANGVGKSYSRGIGSINYGDRDDFTINEVPLSLITQDTSVVSSFSNYKTGVFVLSRTGGEGNDLARGMYDYVDTSLDKNAGKHPDANSDKYKSYLQPDSIELEIMNYINQNFDDFILIVNANNALELDFAKNFNKLSTIVQVPSTGENGLNSLGDILNGTVAASGKLTDTFVKDSFQIPSSQNLGDFEFLVDGKRMPNITNQSNFDGLFYTMYDEGIYVGYRYFETRYADMKMNQGNASTNNFKYEDNVLYPFGYGDTTASFQYSDYTITEDDDIYRVSVKVKNTSSVWAKDVVELYVSKPYGTYEVNNNVEISAIELLAFTKTPLLEPNQQIQVELTFKKNDLRTYMAKGNGQYYLPGGDYYFTLGKDAHAANNNILKYKGYGNLVPSPAETTAGDETLVITKNISQDLVSYIKDASTDAIIKNQFASVDYKTYDSNHKTLSRSDWQTTYPQIQGELSNIRSIHSERTTTSPSGDVGPHEYTKDLEKTSQIYKDVVEYATYTGDIVLPNEIKWNQKSNLDMIDLRGLDIDDERYTEVVSKMSIDDAINLFANGGYQTVSVKSINKPITFDTDGPAGFNAVSGHRAIGYSFPCSLLIGQTWNKELMHEVGEMFGEESLLYEIQGWYGPTANIHRSPFSGRNFEYFSEDPVITGEAAKQELHGAAQYGLYGYLKHFALNDQETHREKENGVCIFANEQTIREIYLRPFEHAIEDNTVEETFYEIQRDANKQIIIENNKPVFIKKTTDINACKAVMSSFSRLGGSWAGAYYPLLNNVLKEEWGFNGIILTDYYHNWFMNSAQSLLGGGNCILDPQNNPCNIDRNDKKTQYMLQEATKQICYCIANSNASNGYIHGVQEIDSWPNYMSIVVGIDIFFGLVASILFLNIVRIGAGFKFKKKDEK